MVNQAQRHSGLDGWHLDKRISIGHLITTCTVAVAMIVWMLQLENRVSVHDVQIDLVEKSHTAAKMDAAAQYAQLKSEQSSQYAELIRRLERIDSRLDR